MGVPYVGPAPSDPGDITPKSYVDALAATKAALSHAHVVNDITNMTGAAKTLNQQNGISDMRTYLGLGNVDNVSDANKPVSSAQSLAIANRAPLVHTHVVSDITDATSVGQALVKSTDAASARSIIGAGTSPILLNAGATSVPAGTPAGTIVAFRA